MSEIKPWREYIGKHDAYIIMCDVLDALCEKEAIKKTVYERLKQAPSVYPWIPCSERLPEPNRHDELNVDVYYLAQTEFGDMIVASYNESHEGTKWWEQMYSYRIFDDEIVAWMPLPEAYKEVKK